MNYKMSCWIDFVFYVQTHEEHDNVMVTQKIGDIAMRATYNSQGGNYFLILSTDRHMYHHLWTELTMPNKFIDKVHTLDQFSKPEIGLVVVRRDITEIIDKPYDKPIREL